MIQRSISRTPKVLFDFGYLVFDMASFQTKKNCLCDFNFKEHNSVQYRLFFCTIILAHFTIRFTTLLHIIHITLFNALRYDKITNTFFLQHVIEVKFWFLHIQFKLNMLIVKYYQWIWNKNRHWKIFCLLFFQKRALFNSVLLNKTIKITLDHLNKYYIEINIRWKSLTKNKLY